MRKTFKLQRLAVMCALLFAVSACSSDETGQDKNNTSGGGSTADVKDNNTDPSDTDYSELQEFPDVEQDVKTGGEDTDPATDAEPGTDVEPGGNDVFEPDPDAYPEVDPVECAFPAQGEEGCAAGDFGAGTFLTEFAIVEDKSCCHDFNGDGKFNNFLGGFIGMLNELPGFGDINVNISTAINTGELVYLFEYSGLDHPEYDSDFQLTVFEGRDNDDDFAPNVLGAGEFEVLPHSYEMPDTPKWRFKKARVHDGELLATGGTLRIRFPGMLDEIVMILEDVRVRAKVEQDGDMTPDLTTGGRVWLSQGELAGALNRDTLFESLNEAARGCECIQDVDDIYTYDSVRDTYRCAVTNADEARCQSASAECQNLATKLTCTILAGQSGKVDVDTDNDGKPDAFSFGARFTGVGASIVGVATD